MDRPLSWRPLRRKGNCAVTKLLQSPALSHLTNSITSTCPAITWVSFKHIAPLIALIQSDRSGVPAVPPRHLAVTMEESRLCNSRRAAMQSGCVLLNNLLRLFFPPKPSPALNVTAKGFVRTHPPTPFFPP